MGKPRNLGWIVLGLALLAAAVACDMRSAVTESSVISSATSQFTFAFTASPNVLYASPMQRDSSLIKLVVEDGGSPVQNVVVFFTVQSGPAVFSDFTWRVSAVTNASGIASATLLGPLKSEMSDYEAYVIVSVDVKSTSPHVY